MKRVICDLLLVALLFLSSQEVSIIMASEKFILQNDCVGLVFDDSTGTLRRLQNKLTGEVYQIEDDEFAIEAVTFKLDFSDVKLASLEVGKETLRVRYQGRGMTIEVTYTLRRQLHFVEKQMFITSKYDYGLRRVILSRMAFSGGGLRVVPYRYQKNVTYFGRTSRGGFFTGVELPFDDSSLKGIHVTLGYAASLKVRKGEKLSCEPIYLGVYQRYGDEKVLENNLPLRCESDAVVEMTSAILGPPRHGLVPMACGWMSEMEHFTYWSEDDVDVANRSLDFLAECGIDWVSDSHPWGGETDKMNALVDEERYEIGPLVRRFLQHAKQAGVKVVFWPTLNNTHPWWRGRGKPFRPDRPHWLMIPDRDALAKQLAPHRVDHALGVSGNCFAHKPFRDWLTHIMIEGIRSGGYPAWAIDGSFFGHGGAEDLTLPANCLSPNHDHLPGDSNYACERSLDELTSRLRQEFPDLYVFLLRPPMDLGVWSLRNADACFTLHESGRLLELKGLENRPLNVMLGDKIRIWSRIRVYHHFYPHYLDQPIVFPRPKSMGGPGAFSWSSEKIDYIMLSALSCSPNQLYYLPTQAGIPNKDKAEIRRWLEWGRRNVRYLQVRRDLPNWPAAGNVDGFTHIIGKRGFIFLFNPNPDALLGEFVLLHRSIGLEPGGKFQVTQEYPESNRHEEVDYGQTVRWPVSGQTAVILQICSVKQ